MTWSYIQKTLVYYYQIIRTGSYHGKGELQTATFPTILELFLSMQSGHIPHEPLVVPAEVGFLAAA